MSPTTTSGDDLLNIGDMCVLLGKTKPTLYAWSRRGFPDWPEDAMKLPCGSWRVRRRDFDRWLESRMVPRAA